MPESSTTPAVCPICAQAVGLTNGAFALHGHGSIKVCAGSCTFPAPVPAAPALNKALAAAIEQHKGLYWEYETGRFTSGFYLVAINGYHENGSAICRRVYSTLTAANAIHMAHRVWQAGAQQDLEIFRSDRWPRKSNGWTDEHHALLAQIENEQPPLPDSLSKPSQISGASPMSAPAPAAPAATDKQQTITVDVTTLGLNPWNREINRKYIEETLKPSIREHGVQESWSVRPDPNRPGFHQNKGGNHRTIVLQELVAEGLEQFRYVTVIVAPATDLELMDHALAENRDRLAMNTMDVADALHTLTEPPFGLSQADAGVRFGITSQSTVSHLISLRKLAPEIQALVRSGHLVQQAARALLLVNRIDQPAAISLAKAAAEVEDESERVGFVRNHVANFLSQRGKRLENVAWPKKWPNKPIAVENPADDQPETIGQCESCAFFFERNKTPYCARPACYALKQEAAIEFQLQRLSKRTGIPIAAPEEKTEVIYDGHKAHLWAGQYDGIARAKEVILAKFPELRLVASTPEAANMGGWRLDDVFNTSWVSLAATSATAIQLALKKAESQAQPTRAQKNAGTTASAAPATRTRPTDAAADAPTDATPTASATEMSAREIEEQLDEVRRQERAAALHIEANMRWLFKNFVELVAPQLTISGPVLTYVVFHVAHLNLHNAENVYGIKDYLEVFYNMELKGAQGKDFEAKLRQRLVATEALKKLFYSETFKEKTPERWQWYCDSLQKLATGKPNNDYDEGFGVTLPKGWNTPPLHKTDFNCHTCGRFTAQRRVTKRDEAAGWVVVTQGETVLSVKCPSCAKAKSEEAAPAAKSKATKAQPAKAKAITPAPKPNVGASLGSFSKPAGISVGKLSKRAKTKGAK